ncbi:hypothetical protein ACA910_010095 [Epithemia clementina (nom. ined.)]
MTMVTNVSHKIVVACLLLLLCLANGDGRPEKDTNDKVDHVQNHLHRRLPDDLDESIPNGGVSVEDDKAQALNSQDLMKRYEDVQGAGNRPFGTMIYSQQVSTTSRYKARVYGQGINKAGGTVHIDGKSGNGCWLFHLEITPTARDVIKVKGEIQHICGDAHPKIDEPKGKDSLKFSVEVKSKDAKDSGCDKKKDNQVVHVTIDKDGKDVPDHLDKLVKACLNITKKNGKLDTYEFIYEAEHCEEKKVAKRHRLLSDAQCDGESCFVCSVESGKDPHFMTWTGDRYDFHGECDLVLLHGLLETGKKLNIHIRTKIYDNHFSYIEYAAVQIGDDVLEVKGINEYWINGKANPGLPAMLGGMYPLTKEAQTLKRRIYLIDLGNGEHLIIKTYKMMVTVAMEGSTVSNFGNSVGLMGDFDTGLKLGRNGTVSFTDPHEFAFEWQVRPGVDPFLFRSEKGPQYPQKCLLPDKERRHGRRLGQLNDETAFKACAAAASARDVDSCMYDVLAANNVDLANAYYE